MKGPGARGWARGPVGGLGGPRSFRNCVCSCAQAPRAWVRVSTAVLVSQKASQKPSCGAKLGKSLTATLLPAPRLHPRHRTQKMPPGVPLRDTSQPLKQRPGGSATLAPSGLLWDSLCYYISKLPRAVYLHHILMSDERSIAENFCNKVQILKFSLLATSSQLFKAKQQTRLSVSDCSPETPDPAWSRPARPTAAENPAFPGASEVSVASPTLSHRPQWAGLPGPSFYRPTAASELSRTPGDRERGATEPGGGKGAFVGSNSNPP